MPGQRGEAAGQTPHTDWRPRVQVPPEYYGDHHDDHEQWIRYYWQIKNVLSRRLRNVLEIGAGTKVVSSYLRNNGGSRSHARHRSKFDAGLFGQCYRATISRRCFRRGHLLRGARTHALRTHRPSHPRDLPSDSTLCVCHGTTLRLVVCRVVATSHSPVARVSLSHPVSQATSVGRAAFLGMWKTRVSCFPPPAGIHGCGFHSCFRTGATHKLFQLLFRAPETRVRIYRHAHLPTH